MSISGDEIGQYGPTVTGALIGTAAKYGLTLSEGRTPTWRTVFADLLQLGLVCLLAVMVSEGFQLVGNAKVLAGALTAVSSDRVIKLARDRFAANWRTMLVDLLKFLTRGAPGA